MRLFVTLAVAALLLVPATGAKDFQEVSGAYTVMMDWSATTFDQRSKNMCVVDAVYSLVLSGDLSGSVDVRATVNHKGFCYDFSLPATVHGKGSCLDASLGDKPGTFDVSVAFQHDAGIATGQMTIQHATGELAGLHGILHIEGGVGGGGEYSGKLHFAP